MQRLRFCFNSLLFILFVFHFSSSVHSKELKLAPWNDENTLFRGDNYRYGNMSLFSRTIRSIVALPNSVRYFDSEDYLTASIFAAPVIGFMLPLGNPYDLRLQKEINKRKTNWSNDFYPHFSTMDFFLGVGGVTLLTYGLGYAINDEPLIEYGSLYLEGLAAAQIFHSAMKLSTGREGPGNATKTGKIYGPTRLFYPAGTPSGHVLTYYYTTFLAAFYFESAWLEAFAHVSGLYIASSLVYNNQHFISDVIWGAPMGYYTAKWMMRHRSSKYSYKKKSQEKLSYFLAPSFNPYYQSFELGLNIIHK